MQETLRLGGRRPAVEEPPRPPSRRKPHPAPRKAGRERLGRAERGALVARLRADGARIAERFGLRYRAIEAEGARVKRRYGSCFSDGVIKIRLTHATTGCPLKYSSMIDTLCHELAHLKYFHHGPRFRDFYEVILDWARREGIYQPSPRRGRPAAPPAVAATSGYASRLRPARAAPRRPSPDPRPQQMPLF